MSNSKVAVFELKMRKENSLGLIFLRKNRERGISFSSSSCLRWHTELLVEFVEFCPKSRGGRLPNSVSSIHSLFWAQFMSQEPSGLIAPQPEKCFLFLMFNFGKKLCHISSPLNPGAPAHTLRRLARVMPVLAALTKTSASLASSGK